MKTDFFRLLLILLFLGLAGCASPDTANIQNLNEGKIDVIGHAGSGFLYPMFPFNPFPPNSRASIEKALKNKADGVEVDVQMSEDSVLVLFHDPNLEALEEKETCVSELPASELLTKKFDTGPFYNLFHDEGVISLEDLLEWFSSLDQYPLLHLDLKNFDDCLKKGTKKRAEVFAEELYQLLHAHKVPLQNLLLGSSDKDLLLALKKFDPTLTLMLDENTAFDTGLNWVLKHKMNGLVIGQGIAEKENIRKAHQKGVQVVVFGGKSRGSIIKMIDNNPDAIQVNNVKLMRSLLD